MGLPSYEPRQVPEGHYTFVVSEEYEKRKGEKDGLYIIFKFKITSKDGAVRKYNDIFVPWEERYRDLLLAFGAKEDEKGQVHLGDINIIGKQFEADIVHIKDPGDSSKIRDKIANIKLDDDVPKPAKIKEADVFDAPHVLIIAISFCLAVTIM